MTRTGSVRHMKDNLEDTLRRLAEKWHEVPTRRLDRTSTKDLLKTTDSELLDEWEAARRDTSDGLHGFRVRGWYHVLYGPWASGKKILEVGPGLGIDGVFFAQMGARMTFVDVSQPNLDVLRRIWTLKGLAQADFVLLDKVERLNTLDDDYDAVFASGSLHHMPSDVGKPEFEALARRLKPGGRFIVNAYPFQRWVDEGQMPFEKWGEMTDGPGTPWAEWYHAEKLMAQLRPSKFALVLYCEFHDGAMNCIDLVKIDDHPALETDLVPVGARPYVDAVRLTELRADLSWSPSAVSVEVGSVAVMTAPKQWAYAASAPIHHDCFPTRPARCFIQIRATVVAGRIGLGVVAADGRSFLAEKHLAEGDLEQTCCLDVHDFMSAKAFIIRNASPKGTRSKILIRNIEVFSSS